MADDSDKPQHNTWVPYVSFDMIMAASNVALEYDLIGPNGLCVPDHHDTWFYEAIYRAMRPMEWEIGANRAMGTARRNLKRVFPNMTLAERQAAVDIVREAFGLPQVVDKTLLPLLEISGGPTANN